MATINMLRGLLVAGAVLAAIVALAYGEWVAALILLVGVAAHGALWVHLRRERLSRSSGDPQPPAVNPS